MHPMPGCAGPVDLLGPDAEHHRTESAGPGATIWQQIRVAGAIGSLLVLAIILLARLG